MLDPQALGTGFVQGLATGGAGVAAYGTANAIAGGVGWATNPGAAFLWALPFWVVTVYADSEWFRTVTLGLGAGVMASGLDRTAKKQQKRRRRA